MKYIDLHTHSRYSDGSMTPGELVSRAAAKNLSAISLTDHDSVDGVEEALAEGKRLGVEVIPGVELSAISDTETHILGYFIDIYNKELLSALEFSKKVREERESETCKKLNELGFDISPGEVKAKAGGGIICRAHFAAVMVEKGYVFSVREAFDKYLNSGKAGYSGKQALTDTEAVSVINKAGGVAFLAHPHLTKKPMGELKRFVTRLKGEGLSGIEGYYTDYTPQMEHDYLRLAKELGLLVSGGTDYHGSFKPHIEIGTGLGNLKIPYLLIKQIKEWSLK